MAIAQNYPKIRPSLNLSFALTKALDPRITYARASAATYYGTETAKAEENLLIQSQTLTTGGGATVTNNNATAPNATFTAATIIEDGTTGIHAAQSSPTILAAVEHTISFFAKSNGRSFIALRLAGVTRVWFDVSNGVVGTTGGGVNASIVASAEGYYRCVATFTPTVGAQNLFFRLGNADNSDSYAGDGVSGVNLWGMQIEQRDSATNYTPTTTQPITNFVPVLESAAAGEARFDHNPVTGESLGLLIEESRTNLVLRSEEFDDAGWAKAEATVTANAVVAPDGTLTADAVIENTATAQHRVNQNLTKAASAAQFTISVYAKTSGSRNLIIISNGTSFNDRVEAGFNLTTGTATVGVNSIGNFTGGTSSITSVGNGWYRCSVTFTTDTSTGLNSRLILTNQNPVLNPSSTSYTGDGFSGIFIWGASVEQGAFPTSYIPTTTAQVTRAADAASMTGANFSSFYNQAEGTFYTECITQVTGTNRTLLSAEASNSDRVELQINTSNFINPRTVISGAALATLNAGPYTAGTNLKLSFAFGSSSYASSTNGLAVATSTVAGLLPIVSTLNIGTRGTNFLNGHISKVSYYPKRIANDQLQGLTT